LHSCRWRLFGNWAQEQSFRVQGGLAWFKNILIAGCETIEEQKFEVSIGCLTQGRVLRVASRGLLCKDLTAIFELPLCIAAVVSTRK
jgi:hypothetical protein